MSGLQPRAGRCVGWRCLTPAEKFGIIFSVVVVVIVLAIAWMYYMGRKAISHRNRYSRTLPGGRQTPKNPNLPPNVALGELPIAQQWPGQPPQVFYQPVVYDLSHQQTPRAFPYLIAGPSNQAGSGVIDQGQFAHFPAQVQAPFTLASFPAGVYQAPQQAPDAVEYHRPRREANRTSFQDHGIQDQPPTWRQRLSRLLKLPVGRASTITSDSTSRSATPQSTESNPCQQNRPISPKKRRNVHSNPVMRLESPIKPTPPVPHTSHDSGSEAEVEDDRSMDTNVATVHSDDYDLPVRQRATTSRQGSRPGMGSKARTRDGTVSDQEGDDGDLGTIPSVSSVSADNNRAPELHHEHSLKGQGQQQPPPPNDSDLRSRSSITKAAKFTDREAVRRAWDRRHTSGSDSSDGRGPEAPSAVDEGIVAQ